MLTYLSFSLMVFLTIFVSSTLLSVLSLLRPPVLNDDTSTLLDSVWLRLSAVGPFSLVVGLCSLAFAVITGFVLAIYVLV